jgi:hypothetical protein
MTVGDGSVMAVVDTRRSMESVCGELSAWAADAHRELIEPTIERAGETSVVEVWTSPRQFAAERRIRYPEAWPEAIAAIAAGKVGTFVVEVASEAGRHGRKFELVVWNHDAPQDDVRRVTLRARSASLVSDGIAPPVQRWVESLERLAPRIGATYGYTTLGEDLGGKTPLERSLRRGYFKAMSELDTRVRGCFWQNLLSRGHVEALGGVERVMRRAPVARAVDLSTDENMLVSLQLTDDLFSMTGDDVDRLAAYLAPVLPVREPVSPDLAMHRRVRGRAQPQSPPTKVKRSSTTPDVVVTLVFRTVPDARTREKLEQTVDGWYQVGITGGFGAWLHNIGPITFEDERNEAEWACDLGDTNDLAVDVLVRSLIGLSQECGDELVSINVADAGDAGYAFEDTN